MRVGDRIVTPGGWIATVQSGKTSGGTIAIEWVTGPLAPRPARISPQGCRVVPMPVALTKRRRRGRIIRRDGKVI